METGTPVKKRKSFKYLPYTLQCRNVDIKVNHCNVIQCLHFSTVLRAVITFKQCSGITVESGTPVKSVNQLNIFVYHLECIGGS